MRCPICKKAVEAANDAVGGAASSAPKHFPFCSERCKLIDLGRWLDGKYQVPVVETDQSMRETSDVAPED